ncbi:GNAT family N-acetyltransferase [Pelagibacterium halotolerans]|uniref:GNAT family N-acetyltransferase n=1 Tax=Pelagibacterium halotolerans TaxID=531813 RepID=UPI003850020D
MKESVGIAIREARPDDAAACAEVMRNSIRELCTRDHGNRDDILNGWLANKTPEIVRGWIAEESNILLVAERRGAIVAVGSARHSGEITLNYVAPSVRFMGVSKAVLAELESRLAALGVKTVRLTSTNTAREFYSALGYVPDGPVKPWRGETKVHPMIKALAPPARKSASLHR